VKEATKEGDERGKWVGGGDRSSTMERELDELAHSAHQDDATLDPQKYLTNKERTSVTYKPGEGGAV
jgi:hypothetical protein